MNKLLFAGLSIFAATLTTSAVVVNFDDLTVPDDGYYNGSDSTGFFTSDGVSFSNYYDTTYSSWDGFAYSNLGYAAPTSSDYSYQYNLAATSAYSGSNYAICYAGYYSTPTITLTSLTCAPQSIMVTNTAYAWADMTYGSGFSSVFTTGDYFTVTFTGYDASGTSTGYVTVYLADFTNGNSYILTTWEEVDLTSLGDSVSYIEVTFASSDTGDYGINTPTYVAIDDFIAVPEPSAFAAFAGLFALGFVWKRSRK